MQTVANKSICDSIWKEKKELIKYPLNLVYYCVPSAPEKSIANTFWTLLCQCGWCRNSEANLYVLWKWVLN